MDVRDTGGSGAPVVFLHGVLVDGSLWDPVLALLGQRRCVVPTLPLGSHTEPAPDRSVLTPVGEKIVFLYRDIEAQAAKTCAPQISALTRMMKR